MYEAKIRTFEVFPTSLIVVDVNSVITQDHKNNMIHDIDEIIEQGTLMQDDEFTPKFQSRPVLWKPGFIERPHWSALHQTFFEACGCYLETVKNFVKHQQSLEPTGMRAWFYKSYQSLNLTQSNPWHNHLPSFLSGVFYLQVPGDLTTGGTEFGDPRGSLGSVRDVEMVPQLGAWVIFPGWMNHRTVRVAVEEPRYVIAADCYVRI